MNRQSRKQMAEETLRIVESGEYVTHTGSRVVFKDRVTASIQGTRVFTPETLTTLIKGTSFLATETTFDVRNETSLSAARRLVGDHGGGEVFCLNFASAKNPGGGFLGGSEAQEESLARSSTLYATLQSTPSYYDVNRACGTALYTDHMILSPDVTVFRDDDGVLLDEPYEVTFITAPAVNAGAVSRNEPGRKEQIVPVMRRRVAMVLALAANHGCSHLVLGAWGCGVFRNDPSEIASLFAKCLLESGQFADCFETVNFAVLDRPGGIIIEPFLKHFFPTESHA
tara:strand:+ start:61 stop:912 length:852 start_codon:yes stop_codon:yes gene_type:complete